MKFPKLASTFRELVTRGKDGFYKGRIAQAIVDLIKSKGGMMELDDLARHRTAIVKPIKYTYAKDVTIYEASSFQSLYTTSPMIIVLSVLRMDKELRYCLLWVS